MAVLAESPRSVRRRAAAVVDPPCSRQLSAGGDRVTTAPYRVCILGTWWIIPTGERWNQASVPRPFWLFIGRDELGDGATLGHDKLYHYRGALPYAWLDRSVPGATWRRYSRHDADTFLRRQALLEGAPAWKANAGTNVVRAWWWTGEALGLSREW